MSMKQMFVEDETRDRIYKTKQVNETTTQFLNKLLDFWDGSAYTRKVKWK